jgi:hypothetical protein
MMNYFSVLRSFEILDCHFYSQTGVTKFHGHFNQSHVDMEQKANCVSHFSTGTSDTCTAVSNRVIP